MINLECVEKVSTKQGLTFNKSADRIRVSFPKVNNISDYWFFYNNGRWIHNQLVGTNYIRVDSGKWECDGGDNYKIFAGDSTYISDNGTGTGAWMKSTPVPDPTTTEPVTDDSFPLKVGKEGPNVVKLQKFLNDKIPSNPLTVNGRFDEKTKNKLIEYQKKEGIIK